MTPETATIAGAPASEKRIASIPRIFVVVFLVKATVLLLVLPALGDTVGRRYTLGFADLYDVIGNNLAQGIGYRLEPDLGPTMVREPGYPFFLAGVFSIGGYHIEAARVANLALMAAVAAMMMWLGRRVTGNSATALVATLLFLFYPGTLISEARGGIEIFFIAAVLLFMLALHKALDEGKAWRFFTAGLLLGVVVMIRSTPLLFPAFLFAYLALVTPGMRARLKLSMRIGLLVAGMAIVVLPWVVRNYWLVHELIPTATVQGVTMQEGQYTCQRLGSGTGFRELQARAGVERNEFARLLGIPFRGTYYQFFYSPADEVRFNKHLVQKAVQSYRDDPVLLVRCSAQNAVNFWVLGKTWQTTGLNALIQVPLLLLSFGGAYLLWKRGSLAGMGIPLTFAGYMMAVHLPLIAHARHSIPVVPFLMILVGVAVTSIWDAMSSTAGKARRAAV